MASFSEMIRRDSVLWWLAGINAAVFVILTVVSYFAPDVAGYFVLPGNVGVWLARPWTALTYMVTHVDFFHLLFNMLTFLWMGTLLLTRLSQTRLLVLYIGGGLCGAFFFLALCSLLGGGFFMAPPLTGASASVLAVMTAAGCLMGNYTLHLFFLGDVKLKWIVVAMILLSLLSAGGGFTGGGVAHLGGIVFGALWSLWILKRQNREKRVKKTRLTPPTAAGARRVASIMEQNRLDKIRLDELLDKIKVSGYKSLSRSERAELDEISRRISK